MHVYEQMQQLMAGARLVDLSHTLEEGMPVWPTQPQFKATVGDSLEKGCESYWRGIQICEHTGTHIDAPAHFIAGGTTIDKIPADQVFGRAAYIDASATAPRGTFPLSGVKAFEAANGEIKEGDLVMFRFGWDEKYGDAAAYMRDWPGLSAEAAEYLRDKKVKAVGCDTLALDAAGSANPCHYALLGSGVCIIENLDHLQEMPPWFYVVGLPLRFTDGSASPLRVLALLDR